MFEVKKLITDQLASGVEKYTSGVVKALSEKYKFDYDEAIESVGLDKVKVTQVSGKGKEKAARGKVSAGIPLPYCGKINEECCRGIRLNHGLMTQCVMLRNGGEEYCKTCQGQATKNANGLPTYGNISTRGDEGWRTPGGKQPVAYGNVMEKLGITREEAIRAAESVGLTINEEQFNKRAAQRGRPSKKVGASTSDTESEDDKSKAKKKRGRPKKEKKVVNGSSGDDLIANLMAEAKVAPVADVAAPVADVAAPVADVAAPVADVAKEADKWFQDNVATVEKKLAVEPQLVASPVKDDSSDDEEESMVVSKFEFEGKTYLKDEDNGIWDINTQEHIGNFDDINNCIDYCDDDDEE
jgi:hypothetical protein